MATAELNLDEAIKQAQEWQESSHASIPCEIVTGLLEGYAEVREVLEGLRNLILRDGTSCWCDGRMTVTIGSHEEQCARARDLLSRLKP